MFAPYLTTKLLHELSGPISGVNNGVELLTESSNHTEESIELLELSGAILTTRLQFYRRAFGTVSEKGSTTLAELIELAIPFFKERHIKVESTGDIQHPIRSAQARLLCNAMLVASYGLIHGGTLTLEEQENTLILTISGEDIKLSETTKTALNGKKPSCAMDSHNIVMHFFHALLEEEKEKSRLEERSGTFSVQITEANL